jgi:hypothetical protein
MMDNIGGGFFPGTGDLIGLGTGSVTAKAGATAKAKSVLDFAFP